jgi:hypothetical protein
MEVRVNYRSVILAAAFLLLVAGSAAAQQVTYNFMPGVNFSNFHTYKWVEIPGGVHPNQIVDQEIKQAVNNVLAGKGFTPATGDKADLYVGYQCFIQQQRQWNAWGMGGGLRSGGMGSAMGPSRWTSTTQPRKNSCGAERRHKPWTLAVTRKKTCRS